MADSLALIPADTPLVLGFPHLGESSKKLEAFLQKYDPAFRGLDLDEVQRGFNLADGTLDTSAPVYLVLTRPWLEESAFALIFTPRNPSEFRRRLSGRDDALQRCPGPEGAFWLAMRGNSALVSLSPRALRTIMRSPADRSLAALADAPQKAIFARSDVFVHLPLAKWRDRIQPFFFLAANMVKLSAMAERAPLPEEALAMFDWFTDGLQTLVDQMESVTLALDFDGRVFGLTHHHAFTRDGSVSTYLGQVRRNGLGVWDYLPDRPFLITGAFDWQCPAESSITKNFSEFVFFNASRSSGQEIAPGTREQLRQALIDSQNRMRGSFFFVTSPDGQLHPVQLYGGYTMDDARLGLESIIFLQENATESMASFMGEPFFGKFERRAREGGETLFEMKLELDRMNPLMRSQISDFYGDDARIQETLLDDQHIGYAVASPPAGVMDLVEARKGGGNLQRNEQFRAALSRLPEETHAVVIVDTGRVLSALPIWLAQHADRTPGDGHPSVLAEAWRNKGSVRSGLLLGWACTVQKSSLTGRACIGAEDAVELFEHAKKMAVGLADKLDSPDFAPARRGSR